VASWTCPLPAARHRHGSARPLPPRRLGTWLPGARGRGGVAVTAEVARVAGPVAAAGLGLLYVAPRRDLRIAGLVAWAAGCAWLAYYLAPRGHLPLLAAGAVAGLVPAGAGAALLLRWPWLLALAALACVPARIQVNIGSTQASLLVPMYGVVAAAALALGWQLLRGDGRTRELGPLAWPLAAFVLWSGL